MKHVFVSPHPDDIALSCGGLVALLRDRGESVAIVTVFSGPGTLPRLTPYQRLALGFGSRHRASAAQDEATLRAEAAESLAAVAAAPTPAQVMDARRTEDAAYARAVGAGIVFLDAPDAVFRDYYGDALMGPAREDDSPPVSELRRALAALSPERLYIPFSLGGHVDHRQARRAACAVTPGSAVTPGPAAPDPCEALFYEDFPYALAMGFEKAGQLDPDVMACLPEGATLEPEFVELRGFLARKIENLLFYESQMDRLFGGRATMAAEVRRHAARTGELGRVGPAERYWRVVPAPAGT